jgi:hypothetical protein
VDRVAETLIPGRVFAPADEAWILVGGEQNVLWVQVAVNEASAVGVVEGGGNFSDNANRVGCRPGFVPAQPFVEIAPRYEFQCDKLPLLIRSDFMTGNNAGMTETRSHSTNAQKPTVILTTAKHLESHTPVAHVRVHRHSLEHFGSGSPGNLTDHGILWVRKLG